MMFANHELKLLNASVIVYLIAGALIFHSLDEFADEPAPSLLGRHEHKLIEATNSGQSNAIDNSAGQRAVDNQIPSRLARPFKADQLGQLRLSSVQRMWNITNQLNVLYESNWTELVLAELIAFERAFVESLELATSDADSDGDASLDHDSSSSPSSSSSGDELSEAGESGSDKSKKKENGEVDSKKRKTSSASSVSLNKQLRPTDKQLTSQAARFRSIKKSFVHSLATITTMGK